MNWYIDPQEMDALRQQVAALTEELAEATQARVYWREMSVDLSEQLTESQAQVAALTADCAEWKAACEQKTEIMRAHSDERQALQRQVLALQQELAAMTKKLSEYRNQYIWLEGMYGLLQQERDGLITDCVEKEASKNNMWFQLAASQDYAQQLREILYDASQIITFEGAMWYLLGLESRDDALNIPADTSALGARLKEEREKCAMLAQVAGAKHVAETIRSLK